jgi:hypothetical protein
MAAISYPAQEVQTMTSTPDAQQTDDQGQAEPTTPGPRPSRLNQALAWVGIVAGGLFVVAAIFFSGFFLSWSEQMGMGDMSMGHGSSMDCCSHMKPGEQMKPDEHMKPGAMMSPGSQMTPGAMMPSGMMGPAVHSPATTAPSTPRP